MTTVDGRPPGSDDADRPLVRLLKPTTHVQDGRTVEDLFQTRGIAGVVPGEGVNLQPMQTLHLGIGRERLSLFNYRVDDLVFDSGVVKVGGACGPCMLKEPEVALEAVESGTPNRGDAVECDPEFGVIHTSAYRTTPAIGHLPEDFCAPGPRIVAAVSPSRNAVIGWQQFFLSGETNG